jgi:hypothetical protein
MQEKHLTRQMHSDGKKRRSFLALLFPAGDLRRYVFKKELKYKWKI